MFIQIKHLQLIIIMAWLIGGHSLADDALTILPDRWVAKVTPIRTIKSQGNDSIAIKALQTTRSKVAETLLQPKSTTREVATAYGNLAAIYHVYEIPSAAEICYLNALKLQPENFRWQYLLAWLWLERGRSQKALEQLRKSATINPDYPALTLRQGQAWLGLNQLERAKEQFHQATEHTGLRALAFYYLGQIAILERQTEKAIAYFQQALKLAPNANAIHLPLAQALRLNNQTEEAKSHLKHTGKQLPAAKDQYIMDLAGLKQSVRPLFLKAMQAVGQRNYAKAIEHFHQGLEIDGNNTSARVSYARALFLDNSIEKAKQQLNMVLKQSENNANAHFFLAIILESEKGWALAKKHYQATLQLSPMHTGGHFYLANLLYREHHLKPALAHYSQAIEHDPELIAAQFNQLLAQYQIDQNDNHFYQALQQLNQSYPSQPVIQFSLIYFMASSKAPDVQNQPLALQQLQQNLNQFPFPYQVDLLVRLQSQLGHFEQAIITQQQIISQLKKKGLNHQNAEQNLAQLRAGQSIPIISIEKAQLFIPQPADPYIAFANYPVGKPY